MVDGDGLENHCRETYRGFESHPFRQIKKSTNGGLFYLVDEMSIWTHGAAAQQTRTVGSLEQTHAQVLAPSMRLRIKREARYPTPSPIAIILANRGQL